MKNVIIKNTKFLLTFTWQIITLRYKKILAYVNKYLLCKQENHYEKGNYQNTKFLL